MLESMSILLGMLLGWLLAFATVTLYVYALSRTGKGKVDRKDLLIMGYTYDPFKNVYYKVFGKITVQFKRSYVSACFHDGSLTDDIPYIPIKSLDSLRKFHQFIESLTGVYNV